MEVNRLQTLISVIFLAASLSSLGSAATLALGEVGVGVDVCVGVSLAVFVLEVVDHVLDFVHCGWL